MVNWLNIKIGINNKWYTLLPQHHQKWCQLSSMFSDHSMYQFIKDKTDEVYIFSAFYAPCAWMLIACKYEISTYTKWCSLHISWLYHHFYLCLFLFNKKNISCFFYFLYEIIFECICVFAIIAFTIT